MLDELLAQKPPYLETLFEKGMLLEAEAEAGQGTWSAALNHWEDLTRKMERIAPAAGQLLRRLVSRGLGALQAKRTRPRPGRRLMGVMRLSPERRRSGNEGEIPGPAREAQVKMRKQHDMSISTSRACAFVHSGWRWRRLVAIGWCVRGPADDVNLITGRDIQAGDRRARVGARCSPSRRAKSSSAGRHHDEGADRPDPVDPLRRPVGERSRWPRRAKRAGNWPRRPSCSRRPRPSRPASRSRFRQPCFAKPRS